jgi:hypothetical protein
MDHLRRVWHFIAGTDARRVDLLLFVLEFIVAFLIAYEFIWAVRKWNDERKRRKERETRILHHLSSLTDDERAALKKWVLDDDGKPTGPNETLIGLNRKIPHAIRHEISFGAEIREEYLPFLQKWAAGRIGSRKQ